MPELIELWGMNIKTTVPAKKKRERQSGRCVELGLNIADLDLLTIGCVNDMFNEKSRDSMEWKEQASQSEFDKF